MTKAERQALREQMAGPKVTWKPQQGGFVLAGDCHWLGERYAVLVYQLGCDNWVWWVGKVRELGTGSGLPTLEAAKTAAETWLADHLIPHRRDVLALLDWADRVEEAYRAHLRCTKCGSEGERAVFERDGSVSEYVTCECRQRFAELFGEEEAIDDQG